MNWLLTLDLINNRTEQYTQSQTILDSLLLIVKHTVHLIRSANKLI